MVGTIEVFGLGDIRNVVPGCGIEEQAANDGLLVILTPQAMTDPTGTAERRIAQHPSLKPQSFLRQLVRAVLPLGEGTILDPFAGGSVRGLTAAWCGRGYLGVDLSADQLAANAAQAGEIGCGGGHDVSPLVQPVALP